MMSQTLKSREAILAKWADDDFALAFARIENHYFTGKDGVAGFFPREGWLLEEENLAKIRHIPTVIVQGRYDVVCPPVSAYELHQRLPGSTLPALRPRSCISLLLHVEKPGKPAQRDIMK